MKLFCFFLTIFLVNVSADDHARYMEEVFFTNEIIKLAFNKNDLFVEDNSSANGLEYVIEKMVNDEDYYKCFAKINFMIAVPDELDIVTYIPEMEYLPAILILTKWKHYQNTMQHEIENTLDIAIPKAQYGQDFRSLNLTTLAEHRRHLVKQALQNIFRRKLGSMYNQFIIQLEIRDTLNKKHLNLTALTEQRRTTGNSLETDIRHVLGTVVSEVGEDQSRSAPRVSLLRMCRLMGLYISTKFPTSYIKELQIDPISNTCSLDEGTLVRRLKQINGVWWQISSITSEAINVI